MIFGVTPEPIQPLSISDKQSTDDMRDGEVIQKLPDNLGQVIAHIHTVIFETYSEYDTVSIQKQKNHKRFAILAVFCGSVAIILSILQVFLRSLSIEIDIVDITFFNIFELVSFSIAVIAVCVAIASQQHKGWIKKRFLAERCRSLKFRALIHPYLWCASKRPWNDRFVQWKKQFNEKVTSLKKVENASIKKCVLSDEIYPSSYDIADCSFEVPYLKSVVDYYQRKRLTSQISYFKSRALYFESINTSTAWIPNFCFFASVVCVAGHFGIDFFSKNPNLQLISEILLLLTLLFPIFAIGARTLRSSIEVSRSAALYQTKSKALEHFNVQLDEELVKDFIQWAEILKILWQCENFFENENREWLRMINEAEWFI
jgi:hypothetical protein